MFEHSLSKTWAKVRRSQDDLSSGFDFDIFVEFSAKNNLDELGFNRAIISDLSNGEQLFFYLRVRSSNT